MRLLQVNLRLNTNARCSSASCYSGWLAGRSMLIRETIVHTQTISSMLSRHRKYLKCATELVRTLIRTSFSLFHLIQFTAHTAIAAFAMIIINDTSMRILSISHFAVTSIVNAYILPGKFVAIDRHSCTRDGMRPVRGDADQLARSGTVHLTWRWQQFEYDCLTWLALHHKCWNPISGFFYCIKSTQPIPR